MTPVIEIERPGRQTDLRCEQAHATASSSRSRIGDDTNPIAPALGEFAGTKTGKAELKKQRLPEWSSQ